MLRPGIKKRFRPETLFKPESVVLVGPGTVLGRRVAERMAGYAGRFATAEPGAAAEAADLAVIACAPEEVPAALQGLAASGTGTAVCLSPAPDPATPDLATLADAAGLRVLGPASFGVIIPAIGLDASTAHVPVAAGRVALVSQSAALCRTVLDWAGPNGVGFSHVIGIGGNAQTGFNVTLDWLSRDPGTGAILLDIRSIRDPRTFLAAARAAARLRPVVTVRAGGRLHDPSGREDAVFDAALRRAGVQRVTTLAGLLGAAEVVTRARPARSETLVIVSNAVGPAHLGADAAVAAGLKLLEIDAAAQSVLRLRLPPGPADPGIVWTGADEPMRVAEAASLLAGVPECGGVVAILSPTGPADGAAVAALAAARRAMRVPLIACVPGETTGAAHRRSLAAAGVPEFATPETAVAAFVQLVRQRQVRAAAAELPSRRVLAMAPDRAAVARLFAAVRAEGRDGLAQDEALAVLAAYGIPGLPTLPVPGPEGAALAVRALGFPAVVKHRRFGRPGRQGTGGLALDLADGEAVAAAAARLLPSAGAAVPALLVQHQRGRGRELRITVGDDALFGPAIGFGLGGSAADLLGDVSFDLPPLNLPLARALIGRTRAGLLMRAGSDGPEADREAVADVLVRISQLLIDHPEIAALDINPLFADGAGATAADAWIGLRPAGEAASLAIVPYPAELEHRFTAGEEPMLIRPIRPEDAEAHGALFRRLTPEDVRFRFFNALRELPAEQVARMTQVDYDREMALIAVREETGETAGVCRLVREPGTEDAEFAVLVEPAMKGRGIAAALMRHTLAWGRNHGVRRAVGQVLAENRPMLGFMRSLGATIRRVPEEPDVVEAVIPLDCPPN